MYPRKVKDRPSIMAKFRPAALILLLIFWGGGASAAESPSRLGNKPAEILLVEPYLEEALKNNPELRRLRHSHQASLERIPQARALPDPEINIGYFINADDPETFAGRFSLSAMQMFPWYGTRNARGEEQTADAEALFHALRSQQAGLLFEIQETWFDYTALVLTIEIVRQNREIVADLESIVMIRYETARAGTADLLRIQMEDRRLATRLENLEDARKGFMARFNEMLNRESGSEITIPEQLPARAPAYSEAELLNLAKMKNPELAEYESRKGVAGHRVEAARLEGRPEIGIGLEIMGRDYAAMAMMPEVNEGYIGMVSIKVPLYRSRYDAKIRQALEEKEAVTRGSERVWNRIARQMEENLVDWRTSDRNLRLLEDELIPRAKQAFQVLSEEYGVGNVIFEEVLQVQRELLDLALERIAVLAEQNKAVARIEQLYAARPGE